MEIIEIEHFFEMILVAIGLSYVLSGSVIGRPLRFIWCSTLKHLHLSYFWSIMTCPPCNAWWVGLGVGLAYGLGLNSLALAFATCGVVAIIQAMTLSIGLQAEEDYNEILGE